MCDIFGVLQPWIRNFKSLLICTYILYIF
jgi:hypothetical protein